nr:1484_t:CDS:2 [Entrophospora candida]
MSHYYNREEKRVTGAVAFASFDDNGDVKRVSGEIHFTQSSKTFTYITGQFNSGFISRDRNDYEFLIIDNNNNVIFDFTNQIRNQLSFNRPGTGPFKFNERLQVRDLKGLTIIVVFDSKEIGNARIKLV